MLSGFGNFRLLSTEQLEGRWKGLELCYTINWVVLDAQNWQVIQNHIL